MSYNSFAACYDAFSDASEYKIRAEYLYEILKGNGVLNGILLDLACGTGTLSYLFEEKGYDVIASDISAEMLDIALKKKGDSNILFLNQDMRELDLYGTVNACVCTLDSINHLESIDDVKQTFSRVSLFTEPDGIFIFDVNTEYKHKCILADNCFIFEDEDYFLAWQNELCEDNSEQIYLDIFINKNGVYHRESEDFKEYIYSDEELTYALKSAGFELLNIYDDLSFESPTETTQRKIFVSRKVK